jgi:hypothetical protein
MLKSKIKKLTVEEFEEMLNKKSINLINKKLKGYAGSEGKIGRMLEMYKEGAIQTNEVKYINVNEYVKLICEEA